MYKIQNGCGKHLWIVYMIENQYFRQMWWLTGYGMVRAFKVLLDETSFWSLNFEQIVSILVLESNHSSRQLCDAERDWGQEEKGMTGDEMAGWNLQLDGHEFE